MKDFFNRLRKNVRDFLHKLQKKSWDIPTGSHANPAVPGIPSANNPMEDIIDLESEPHQPFEVWHSYHLRERERERLRKGNMLRIKMTSDT